MRALLTLGLLSGSARAAEPPAGRWVWGDLHAHSGWSFDGCEDAERLCAPRGAAPASDFFANAADQELDFAALTDHAEAGAWLAEGEGGAARDVWQGQVDAVAAAQGGEVLPILGYEWTGRRADERRGHPRGSHRTVLLGGADGACLEARVGGFALEGGARLAPDEVALYTAAEVDPVEQVSDLWRALDEAAEACPGLRWISFAHHSALVNPQVTDWNLKENRPDRESLIEIASEHGSSECLDVSSDGCGWWINEEQGYWPDGSVQAALAQGFALGFVGGTDGHDARPGSLEDGPGSVAHLEDGEVRRQLTRGAITGVFLEGDTAGEGPPALDALFDALDLRRTVVSTGPRPDLEVYALGDDGQIYLPGEALPPSALPAALHLDLGALEPGAALLAVSAIGPGGEILAESAESPFRMTWDGRPGDALYLRLRLSRADGDDEDRIWVSPWFVERRCGCATGAPGASNPALAAGLLSALARRRRVSARSRR